jgi:hypothetical protein
MRNYNALFAITILMLLAFLFALTKSKKPSTIHATFVSIPESKGCVYPIKMIKYTKTEIKHIVPVAQVYKCFYDDRHRLIKVSTYNFERGYQMVMPTEEVLYEWEHLRLSRYTIRKATHGNGEIDAESYRFYIR